MKYLQKFYNQDKCLEMFGEICRLTDIQKKLYLDENIRLYEAASKQSWPKNFVKVSFYITQKEISFINTIDAPREFRMFILGILIYGKYTKQQIGIPMCNVRDRSYIYYLVTHKDEYNTGRRRSTYLNKLLIDRNKTHHGIKFYPAAVSLEHTMFGIPRTVVAFKADWVDWNADSGYLISDLNEDPRKICDLIQDWTKECPCCKDTFVVSPKAKTELCPSCYSKNRRTYEINYQKEKRDNDRRNRNNTNTD